jgi:hypothetical protein
MPISTKREGRRTYLLGAPYGAREQLKAAGAHWDPERRAWWLGSDERARELAAQLEQARAPTGLQDSDTLLGRGRYQGRACLVLWAGDTAAGRRCKCASMDGARIFWAPSEEVEVEKRYLSGWTEDDRGREYQREPMTWGRLLRLREKAQQERATYGYVPVRGRDYCGYPCPVDGHVCTPDHPCHDCL